MPPASFATASARSTCNARGTFTPTSGALGVHLGLISAQ